MGSASLFCRRSSRSRVRARSIPAMEASRFPRRLRDVIAGNGLRVREWSESIMFPERLSARRLVSMERLSGIETKRLCDRSSDVKDPESGTRAVIETLCSPLSARERCLKNRHFVGGRLRGVGGKIVDAAEEWLLPDPDRRMRCDVVRAGAAFLDGELLLGRFFELEREESDSALAMGW